MMDFGDGVSAHNAHFRRLRSASRHPSFRFGWPRSFRFSDEVPHSAQVRFHDHRTEGGPVVMSKRNVATCRFDYDTELKSTTESFRQESDLRAPRQKTSYLSAPNVSVARVFFQPVSLAFKPVESTTLLSRAT